MAARTRAVRGLGALQSGEAVRPNLIVIRSVDPASLATFYTTLGAAFEEHRHGRGPAHYAYDVDGFVFEIYPRQPDTSATTTTRLGFSVRSIEEAERTLLGNPSATIVRPAYDSPWGRRLVFEDPEGHRVELVESTEGGSRG